MNTEKLGVIRTMHLPDDFVKGEERAGGMGNNWRKTFHPKDKSDVSITSLYRGSAAFAPSGRAFRALLAQPSALIYSPDNNSHPQAKTIISSIAPALGNVGDNQITNLETNERSPEFYLQRLETLELNQRRVLVIYGIFHDINKKPHNYYIGVFIDAEPKAKECRIEEVIFEAQTRELYEQYHGLFEDSIKTIEWA